MSDSTSRADIGLSNYNRSIPAAEQQELERMAVIDTLSENEYIEVYFENHKPPATLDDIIKAYDMTGGRSTSDVCVTPKKSSNDPYMEILKDYVSKNKEVGSFQILDYTTKVEVGNGQARDDLGKYLTVQGENSQDIYMAFCGTEGGEGVDNGQLMSKDGLTTQQRVANDYFEDMVEKFGLEEKGARIKPAGHSKGGNRVTAIVMNTKYPYLIEKALNLDGPGSSPEAIEQWKKAPDYEERRQKITKLSGDHDYVHGTGISIEGDIRYVKYDESCLKKGADTLKRLESYHKLQYMFKTFTDAEGQIHFTSELQPKGEPADFVKTEYEFMEYFMSLPKVDREKAAPYLMQLLWSNASPDGVNPDKLKGFISSLVAALGTPEGASLLRSFIKGLLTEAGNRDLYIALLPILLAVEAAGLLLKPFTIYDWYKEEKRAQKALTEAREEAAAYPDFYININAFEELERQMRTFGAAVQEIRTNLANLKEPVGFIGGRVGFETEDHPQVIRLRDKIGKQRKAIEDLKSRVKQASELLESCIPTLNGVCDYLSTTANGFTQAEKKARNLIDAWHESV